MNTLASMNRIFSQFLPQLVVIFKMFPFDFHGIHKPRKIGIRWSDLQPVILINNDNGIGLEPVPPGFRQDDPPLGIDRSNLHFGHISPELHLITRY